MCQQTKEIKFSNNGDIEASSATSIENEFQLQFKCSAISSALYDEIVAQFKISLPTIISLVLYRLPWLISLHFAGGLGPEELAAAALATTLCNITGISLSVGLSSAITTLTGQARGDILLQAEKLKNDNVTAITAKEGDRHTKDKEAENDPLLQYIKSSCAGNAEEYGSVSSSRISDEKILFIEHGEGRSRPTFPLKTLVFLYRGLIIQLALILPVGIWWLHGIKPLLLSLGQGEILSDMTEKYLRILTPGLLSYSINWTVSSWLQAIEMADIPAYAAFVGLLLHVPFNILFIRILGWGYLGVAVATVMFHIIQPMLILIFLFGSSSGRARTLKNSGAMAIGRTSLSFWAEASVALNSFAGIKQYLSLALPGIVVISEWWASETCIFLAGRLQPYPALALGGMSIYQSINSTCFMFPIGFSVAGSTRIGTMLGKNNPEGARLASKVSIAGAAILSTIMGCILFFSPHNIFPSFFSPDEKVIAETSQTIPLLAFYVFADGLQVALNGIIKGCGRQTIVMPIVIVAYWIVGVPLAYYNSFIKYNGQMCDNSYFCGIMGLVGGMTIGTWVHFLLLAITVLFVIDWKHEAKKAQERMSLEKNYQPS